MYLERMNNLKMLMEEIDAIKEEIGDNKYLELSNQLQCIFNQYENIYEVSFITTKFVHADINQFLAKPVLKKQLLLISTEEQTILQEGLRENNNWLSLHRCQEKYSRILGLINYTDNHELIGVPDFENTECCLEKSPTDVEIVVSNSLIVVNIQKI